MSRPREPEAPPVPPRADDPEAALLADYAGGSPDAARALVEALARRVHGHAARVLADPAEAEDVTQEALLRLWRAAPGWRHGGARVRTWLWQVTANLCTDRLRRRPAKAVPIEDVAEPADPAPEVAARLMDDRRAEALSAALATLPERQAQAVALRHLEGLTNPEIAAIMEIGVEAVESLVARGKRGLAEALAGRKEELGYGDD